MGFWLLAGWRLELRGRYPRASARCADALRARSDDERARRCVMTIWANLCVIMRASGLRASGVSIPYRLTLVVVVSVQCVELKTDRAPQGAAPTMRVVPVAPGL